MPKKRILLLCMWGMSTTIIEAAVKEALKRYGEEVEVVCAPIGSGYDVKSFDAIFLAPQVGFSEREIRKRAEKYGIPVGVIDSYDYATSNKENIGKLILSLLKSTS